RLRTEFKSEAQWRHGTSRAFAGIPARCDGVGSRMADKPGSGATIGRRPRTAEQPRSRRDFPSSGAVCAGAAEINSRKKRIAHSCYKFPCTGLRAHVKEAAWCDSKRHDRAEASVIARVDPERVVRMCGRSSQQPEIDRAARWRVLPGQNNIPLRSAESAWANR